jgi:hypothetical protein
MLHVFGKAHFAGRVPAAIGRGGRSLLPVATDADEVEGGVEWHLARQIAEENCRALKHAHEDDGLPGEVAGNLRRHLGDAMRDLLAGDQYLQF